MTPVSTSTQAGVAVSYTATIQDANGNTVSTANNPITFAVSGVSGTFSPGSPVTPNRWRRRVKPYGDDDWNGDDHRQRCRADERNRHVDGERRCG